MAAVGRAPSGAESSTLAERANYIVNIWVVYSGTIQRLSILSRPDMTQTHTLQRGLAGALVIVAGMMGVLVGPASAADGLTPAEITVSADEVANSTIVSKTVQIPVQGSAGDTITFEKNGETSAFSFDSVSVNDDNVISTIQNEEVVLEFQSDIDSTVTVTVGLELHEMLSDETETYNEFPIVELFQDTGSSDSLVYLTVEAGQITDLNAAVVDASPSGEHNGKPVYNLPVSDGATLRIYDFVDEYRNSIADSATSYEYPMGDLQVQAVDANYAASTEFPAWYSDTRIKVADGEIIEPQLGLFEMTITAHDATQVFYVRWYPDSVDVSVEDTVIWPNESTTLSVDLGTNTVDGWVDLSLIDANSTTGEYIVSGDSPEFEFVSTTKTHNVSTIGGRLNDIKLLDAHRAAALSNGGGGLFAIRFVAGAHYDVQAPVGKAVADGKTDATVASRDEGSSLGVHSVGSGDS